MIKSKKWIIYWGLMLILIPIVCLFNYVIDPYGIFNSNIVELPKREQINKVRLLKAVKIKELKPASIILGTSRAEGTFNPNHDYFVQPSYNGATSGSSMYENLKYLDLAIRGGNLKQVLLIADYRMFNGVSQRKVADFDTYFDTSFNENKYLLSIDTLKSSLKTIIKKNKKFSSYLENGLKFTKVEEKNKNFNALLEMINIEKNYYKSYSSGYNYKDSSRRPFNDFKDFITLCYENNITLEIVFGPSHIRLWESLDYYLGINTWNNWKKEILTNVSKISENQNEPPFRVIDFSVYHNLTSEKIPFEKGTYLKYHGESSHYNPNLATIVLNRLSKKSKYKEFGEIININNIDMHIENEMKLRKKFIDSKKYRIELKKHLNRSKQ